MITVHHLNNSRSQRILWLLEELELPYEIKCYQRDPKTLLAPNSLKQIHPLGKSPVISQDDLVIAESGAIIEYLVGLAPSELRPTDTHALIQYTYWLHFAEGSLMPQLLIQLICHKIRSSRMPIFAKPIAKTIANQVMRSYAGPNIRTNLAFVDLHLARNDWFCGTQFSAADIQMSYPLEAAISRLDAQMYPHITAFVAKIRQRSAYQKAIEVGGEYHFDL